MSLLLFSTCAFGQSENIQVTRVDTFAINFSNLYELSAISIVPTSEVIYIGPKRLNYSEYKINFANNILSLSDSLTYSIFDTLIVSYRAVRLNLKKSYQHRNLVKIYDDVFQDSIGIVETERVDLSNKGLFGKDLRSSGTLLRGFTLGTNKDLTVNSGLRLQISGKLTDDIEIVAALTDENTPIQPEGNTERLEELDKVFIEIKHKNASGIFGDYDYSSSVGEFGKVNRKLQGVLGKVQFENYGGTFAFASSRGKYNSMQFNGIDGVQGPYILLGADNENDIIVIAGSEKIYLDGKELKRGENNDYTIEYSNGEITFTPKVLITSISRIIADFEYTNRQYERNIIGTNGNAYLFDRKLKIEVNAMQEGDNRNSPIDLSLSDSDKEKLKAGGDDPFNAALSGVVELSGDSLGIYRANDTLIDGTSYIIYIYDPGSLDAKYNVTFSYVGDNDGDYIRESIGKYKFVGIGSGSYLPIRLIPLPERKQIGNIVFDYSPIKELNLNVELAASSYDRNTFSKIDDEDNNGFASLFKITLNPIDLNIFNSKFGILSASYKDRFKNNRFQPVDRIDEIEFERNYNISDDLDNEETLREFKINFLPVDNVSLTGQYGLLKKGANFSSERILSNSKFSNFHGINAEYNFDLVNSDAVSQQTKWLKQNGRISYSLSVFQPGFEFRSENKRDNLNNNDSLLTSSQQYDEYAPFLLINFSKGLNLTAKYSFVREYAPLDGNFIKESDAYTHTYSLNYRELREFNSSIDFAFRSKKYSKIFEQLGFGNNESVQIRSQNQIRLFDRLIDGSLYYQTSSERTAKLEKVFVRVTQGTGSYSYQGDLNNNGIAEEFEFIPDVYDGDFIQTTVPTDELFPVIDLKFNTRWRIDFSQYFKKNNFISSVLSSLNSETTYRVEENSKIEETEKIYLMNFKYFLNDSTTIRGFNYFQQDLHIFKNQRDLSFRLRFTERNSLNQYSSGLEKAYQKERSLKITFRMIEEINNETEFINEIENVLAPESSNRSRNTISNSVKSDFSYRPYSNFEIGFSFEVGRLEDQYPVNPTIIDENKLTLRFTLSLLQKGRLRLEAERTELIANTTDNIIPFEITNGNLLGKNYIWRANFDYRFSSNLQTNINYSGRLQGQGRVINTMTAEARAYF